MDESQSFSFSQSVRPSGLPRPSRLPLPRSTTIRSTSPERADSRLSHSHSLASTATTSPAKSISFTGSLRGRPPPSLLPTPARPASQQQHYGSVRIQPTQRQPLGTIKRPQTRLDQARGKPAASVVIKVQHDPEEQENGFARREDHAEVDETVILSSSDGSSPHHGSSPSTAVKRGPRPSLSDRTILSLAQVPPTPGSNRRRSAFFNPHSPMATPARPGSAMSSISKLTYGSVRKTGIARPTPSSLSKSIHAPTGFTPRRSVSGGPVTISSMQRPKPAPATISRPASAAPTLRRTSLLRQSTTSTTTTTARPASALSKSVRVPPPKRIDIRPPKQLSQSVNGTRGTSTISKPKTNATSRMAAPSSARQTSSATLRGTIAQARAAQRIKQAVQPIPQDIDFDNCEDPFNQKAKEDDAPLTRRLEIARRDGRLNIAAMGFKEIPAEVPTMYDEEAMQKSSISWNETIDLTYFNAADNEIESISEDVFPDFSNEELAEMEDAKGNQFGGLETLDLHGNMLQTIPAGIRRLERLTTLNLSRNNLTNNVFDVIADLPYLRHLHLASNDLSRVLPDSIAQLASLEVLDLSDNKLVLLPPCIRHLTNLRILNISNNRFSDLSLDTLAVLPHLSEVYAAKNALTSSLFPSTVTVLRSLRILDVSKNSIASLAWASTPLSGSLSLPALTHLNVSSNRLIALPDVTTWSSLTTLLAEENSITSLPSGFTSLSQLRNVNFTSNDIKNLDEQIALMPNLETLTVAGNPLREKKFLTMGTEALKKELGRRLALAEELEGSARPTMEQDLPNYEQDDEMF